MSPMKGHLALLLRVAQRGSKPGRSFHSGSENLRLPLASALHAGMWSLAPGSAAQDWGPQSVWAWSANISISWPSRIVTWHLQRLRGECSASAWGLREQVASKHHSGFQKKGRAGEQETRLLLSVDGPYGSRSAGPDLYGHLSNPGCIQELDVGS